MIIVPNGIDSQRLQQNDLQEERVRVREELGLSPTDFVFLNVASIYPPKAHRFVIKAMKQLLREYSDIKVIFLGRIMDQDYFREIKCDINLSGIAEAVKFPGYCDHPASFYFASDAFLLPSLCEGWSLALMEAAYLDLPVIATDVGGAREIISCYGGEIIEPPFSSITELNYANLYVYEYGEHPRFVQDLASAMKRARSREIRTNTSIELKRTLDCKHAYSPYARIFE